MNSDNAIPYILGYIFAFIIAIFITRAIFSISKFLKFQQAQLQILTEIALQNGVNPEVIASIYNNFDVNKRVRTNEEIRADLIQVQEERDLELEKETLSHPRK